MSRFWVLLPVFVVAVAVLGFWLSLGRDARYIPSALLDKEVISFDVIDLYDGRRVYDKSLFMGRVSVVNVFASWCVPCVAEHPFVSAIAARSEAQMIGLNWRDDIAAARDFLARHGNPYDVTVYDTDGSTAIDWGVSGIPETYIIDKRGIIRFKYVGAIVDESVLGDILRRVEALR